MTETPAVFTWIGSLLGVVWLWLNTNVIAGFTLAEIFTSGLFIEMFVKIWREKAED